MQEKYFIKAMISAYVFLAILFLGLAGLSITITWLAIKDEMEAKKKSQVK